MSIETEFDREAYAIRRAVTAGMVDAATAKRMLHRALDEVVEDRLDWMKDYMRRSVDKPENKPDQDDLI